MNKKEILKRLEEIREDTMYIANPKNTTEFCGVVYAIFIDDLIEEIKEEIEKEYEMSYEIAKKNYNEYIKKGGH